MRIKNKIRRTPIKVYISDLNRNNRVAKGNMSNDKNMKSDLLSLESDVVPPTAIPRMQTERSIFSKISSDKSANPENPQMREDKINSTINKR